MEAIDSINLELDILPRLPITWTMKYYLKFMFYQPQVNIYFENSKYIVKTVNLKSELFSVFRLRYKVFLQNIENNQNETGLEIDYFDSKCDHIIIIDKASFKIIGTYRLICSNFFNEFYSSTEFTTRKFLDLPGTKLELGRACIHPKFRNGFTIDLLWRGIWEYIRKTDANYLFGCSSVPTEDLKLAYSMINYLKSKNFHETKFNIMPRGKYYPSPKESSRMVQNYDDSNFKRFLPPLLRSYLNAGAKVHGNPALDREFKCVDMFTILDLDEVNQTLKKRYNEKVVNENFL